MKWLGYKQVSFKSIRVDMPDIKRRMKTMRDGKQRKRRRAACTSADFVRAAREVVEAFGWAYDGAAR